MNSYKTFAITLLRNSDKNAEVQNNTKKQLEEGGLTETNLEEADLVIVIGGDGALLKTLREAKPNQHILALHTGNAGFLTTAHDENLFRDTISAVLDSALQTMLIPTVTATHTSGDKTSSFTLINDAAIECTMTWLNMSIDSNKTHIKDVRGSGVTIATPTGSTTPMGHFFQSPIIDPSLRVWYIKGTNDMMAPRTGLVLNGERSITITLNSIDHNAGNDPTHHHTPKLFIDGLHATDLQEGDVITLTYNSNPISLLRTPDDTHWHRIRNMIS